MDTKFIFVTGGVVSGLGKGITAASLGRLLKARGLKVTVFLRTMGRKQISIWGIMSALLTRAYRKTAI